MIKLVQSVRYEYLIIVNSLLFLVSHHRQRLSPPSFLYFLFISLSEIMQEKCFFCEYLT